MSVALESWTSVCAAEKLRERRDRAVTETRLPEGCVPDPALDTVVALAAAVTGWPIAMMTLVDDARQWWPASVGVDETGSGIEHSVCATVIGSGRPVMLTDLAHHERWAAAPLVAAGRAGSYVGVPVTGRDGIAVAALCVMHPDSIELDPARVEVLRSLAQLAADELGLRRMDTRAGMDPAVVRAGALDLLDALTRQGLRVHYQPQVDLHTRLITGMEAVVRWEHPTRGLLGAQEILPQAQVSGLASVVDRWVLRTALADLATWRALDPVLADLGVAVNVDAGATTDTAWAREVLADLGHHDIPAHLLTLEVTERSVPGLSEVAPDATEALEHLAAAGVRISIDDIGTGTSSLARLADLPATQVKIDRSLVIAARDPRRAAVLTSLVALGKALGAQVVAEGIEDEATAALMTDLGCDTAQGYLWSPPVDGLTLLEAVLTQRTQDVQGPDGITTAA